MQKPDDSLFRVIGRPVERKEDLFLLTGRGQFSDDFSKPGQTHAVMARSPYPHARIRGIDKSAALAMPGVIAVVTGQDLLDDGIKTVPHDPVPSTKFDMKLTGRNGTPVFIGPHMLLPADKARHVGEAVAMVVAETRAQAQDAMEALEIDWEELPWVTEAVQALEPGAPAVWDELPDNGLVDTNFGDEEATAKAFAEADYVIEDEFTIARVTGVTIEPRAYFADYDAEHDKITLVAGSGGAVRQRREMAHVLGLKLDQIRVLSYDVGGNFGSKNRVYVESALCAYACRKLKRPVKFTATRSEAFLTDYQGRDLVSRVKLAVRKDGKFLAMRAENISNVGCRAVSLSPLSKGSGLITGPYDIPHATLRSRAAFTNTMPTQAYRSSGRPEVTFVIERLADAAAEKLGMDRIAIRRLNLLTPDRFPYTNAVGMVYDSGEYEHAMDDAMRIHDWDGYEARRKDAEARGKLLGLGIAPYVESSIGAPKERTEIYVLPTGRVRVVIGTQPSGQGHQTSFAQVIADMISVPIDLIDIVMGDTDVVSVGGGSHSGRSMRHAGTVMVMGAQALIEKSKRIAAMLLQTTPDQVTFKDGRFQAPSNNRSYDFIELAKEAAQSIQSDDPADRVEVIQENEMHEPVFPNGCAVCEVEVDPDTGEVDIVRYSSVDDVGRCINPLIVDGQTHGAIVQGVGQAMWEHFYCDQTNGQPLTGSLMDYGMPRTINIPSFRTKIAEVLSPTNPLGIKAGGEGGTTGALAVMVSAVTDALKRLGIRNLEMPMTPYRVWLAIQAAKANNNLKGLAS